MLVLPKDLVPVEALFAVRRTTIDLRSRRISRMAGCHLLVRQTRARRRCCECDQRIAIDFKYACSELDAWRPSEVMRHFRDPG